MVDSTIGCQPNIWAFGDPTYKIIWLSLPNLKWSFFGYIYWKQLQIWSDMYCDKSQDDFEYGEMTASQFPWKFVSVSSWVISYWELRQMECFEFCICDKQKIWERLDFCGSWWVWFCKWVWGDTVHGKLGPRQLSPGAQFSAHKKWTKCLNLPLNWWLSISSSSVRWRSDGVFVTNRGDWHNSHGSLRVRDDSASLLSEMAVGQNQYSQYSPIGQNQ